MIIATLAIRIIKVSIKAAPRVMQGILISREIPVECCDKFSNKFAKKESFTQHLPNKP